MSEAENLLNQISDSGISIATADPTNEEHIVIDSNRNIYVPESLRRIAVQYDHNIETVTFDCPRYWDGIDMSGMKIFINYVRSDGKTGCYHAEPVTVDEIDTNIMHFDWTISRNVTEASGGLLFLICIKTTDEEGNDVNHWNSEINRQMSISEGLEVDETINKLYPDIITQLLVRMDAVEADNGSTREYIDSGLEREVSEFIEQKIIDGTFTGVDLNDYATKDNLAEVYADLDSKLDNANTERAQIISDIQDINTSIQNAEESITRHGQHLGDLDGSIQNLETNLNDHNTVITELEDYLIEVETVEESGVVWTYEKWKSGKLVCYAESWLENVAITNLWENGWVYRDIVPVYYPEKFTAAPLCWFNVYGPDATCIATSCAPGTKDHTPTLRLLAQQSHTSQTICVNYHVIGRWR